MRTSGRRRELREGRAHLSWLQSTAAGPCESSMRSCARASEWVRSIPSSSRRCIPCRPPPSLASLVRHACWLKALAISQCDARLAPPGDPRSLAASCTSPPFGKQSLSFAADRSRDGCVRISRIRHLGSSRENEGNGLWLSLLCSHLVLTGHFLAELALPNRPGHNTLSSGAALSADWILLTLSLGRLCCVSSTFSPPPRLLCFMMAPSHFPGHDLVVLHDFTVCDICHRPLPCRSRPVKTRTPRLDWLRRLARPRSAVLAVN